MPGVMLHTGVRPTIAGVIVLNLPGSATHEADTIGASHREAAPDSGW